MGVPGQCTGSAPPGDNDLLAWGDGEATEAVRAHLDQCGPCRRKALEYARRNAMLQARLHRVDCPDPLQLGEYALDLLPNVERTQVAAHVLACLSCTEELALFRADMRSPESMEAPESAWRAVPRLIARLWSPAPGLSAGATGLTLGVRGQAALSTATYAADGIQISVDVQPDGPAHWMLLGLVISSHPSDPAEAAFGSAVGLIVEVRGGDALVARGGVDEMGNFVCPSLPAGTYELAVHLADTVVVIPRLEVGAP